MIIQELKDKTMYLLLVGEKENIDIKLTKEQVKQLRSHFIDECCKSSGICEG